jgi:acyl-CoA synthetase (AMP-forming)/AMP-acid ligase II
VGILSYNTHRFVEFFFAAVLARAVPATLHYRYGPRELHEVLETADPSCLLVDAGSWPDPDGLDRLLLGALPLLDAASASGGSAVPVVAANYSGRLPEVQELGELSTAGGSVPVEAVWQRYDEGTRGDGGTLLFTSGTSSRPKGVLHTTGAQARSAMTRSRLRLTRAPEEVVWTPTPWCHTGGLLALLGALGHGDPVVTSPYFVAEKASAALLKRRVTTAWLMFPALLQRLVAHADEHGLVFPSVRQALHIGTEHWFRQTERIFPNARVVTGYGMTESGSLFSLANIGDPRELRTTTCGRPYDGIELRVVDPATRAPLPTGAVGEVTYRGWNLFEGYFGDDEATRAVKDADGWFHTGDLGTADAGGVLRLMGRAKDVLKVGGENVSPQEVEDVLLRHPSVRMAAVVGLADDVMGEVPAAFVELADGRPVDREELRGHCAGALARFKVPARYFLVSGENPWPQSTTKIDKRVLVEWARDSSRPEIL